MPDLLLLSRWLDTVPDFLTPLTGPAARVGFVPTASMIYPDRAWVDLDRATLRDQGFTPVELDLESMTAGEFISAMSSVEAVFVSGGNVFHLLGVLRRTGTDHPLADAIAAGLPYVGASAGAAIVGSDIGPLALLDDPTEAHPLESTEALGFVDAVIVPHADGLVGGTGPVERLREQYGHTYRLLFLRDDQALVVSDDGSRVIDS